MAFWNRRAKREQKELERVRGNAQRFVTRLPPRPRHRGAEKTGQPRVEEPVTMLAQMNTWAPSVHDTPTSAPEPACDPAPASESYTSHDSGSSYSSSDSGGSYDSGGSSDGGGGGGCD